MKNYDLVVIGSGPGGYVGAIRAAQLGMCVAVVEKADVGGTCLNRGCIPTKALLHTSEVYDEANRHFASLGLQCENLAYDAAGMYERKDAVVAQLRGGVEQLFKANGITLMRGTGTVTGPGAVSVHGEVNEEDITAKHILIATGSCPGVPPIPGAGLPAVVTSDELLREAHIYKRLVIVGAGVIGVEFATLYTQLGCEVTLVEAAPRALPTLGREVAQSVTMLLKKGGATLHVGAAVQAIEQCDDGLLCRFVAKEQEQTVTGDAVLIATGRRPVLDGVFSEGLKPATERGFLVVDEQYRTSIPGVYAIGDVIPTLQLAHAASAEAIAAVEGMAGHEVQRPVLIPSCIYTSPEVATVGLSEEDAAAEGLEVVANKFLMTGNGRVLIAQGERSYVKLVAEAASGRLVGAELVCPRATDMIGGITLAIQKGMKAEELDSIVWAHPTFSEGIGEAAAMFGGGAIHAAPKKRKPGGA